MGSPSLKHQMKILRLLVPLLMVFPSTVFAAVKAYQDYSVYDKAWNVEEHWREKDGVIEIFDKNWARKGYIKKEGDRIERYNKDWEREGEIKIEEGPAPPRR